MEDEDGDFKGKEDREHRLVSEADKLRVTWNTERRCYLELPAVKGCVQCTTDENRLMVSLLFFVFVNENLCSDLSDLKIVFALCPLTLE